MTDSLSITLTGCLVKSNSFDIVEGVSEDDGVLVTVVFNGSSKRSYLLLLDAVDLKVSYSLERRRGLDILWKKGKRERAKTFGSLED